MRQSRKLVSRYSGPQVRILLLPPFLTCFKQKLMTFPAKAKQRILLLAIILLAGAMIRIGWLYWTDPQPLDDAFEYRRLGWQIANGFAYEDRGMRSWRAPGYPFLLSLAYRAGLNIDIGARVVDVATGLGFAVVLGLIVCKLCGWPVGLVAMFFVMFYPNNICLAGISMSQTPFGLFFYLAILLGLYGRMAGLKRRSFIIYILCGAALGYAVLIRASGALAIPFVLAYFGIKDYKRAKVNSVVMVALVLGLTASLSPWVIRNWRIHQRFVLLSTNGGEVFYSANNVAEPRDGGLYNRSNYLYLRKIEKNEVLRSRLGFKLGLRSIVQRPLVFIKSLPSRYARFLGVDDESPSLTAFSLQRKEFRYGIIFSILTKLIYFCIPVCLIVFYKHLWRSLLRFSEVRFFSVLYSAYFLVIPLFEVTARSHVPYMWLIVLSLIYSLSADKSEKH